MSNILVELTLVHLQRPQIRQWVAVSELSVPQLGQVQQRINTRIFLAKLIGLIPSNRKKWPDRNFLAT